MQQDSDVSDDFEAQKDYEDDDESEDALEGTLEELDADGDGRVTLEEFLDAASAVEVGEEGMVRARVLFSIADLDRSRCLDRHELQHLLELVAHEHAPLGAPLP